MNLLLFSLSLLLGKFFLGKQWRAREQKKIIWKENHREEICFPDWPRLLLHGDIFVFPYFLSFPSCNWQALRRRIPTRKKSIVQVVCKQVSSESEHDATIHVKVEISASGCWTEGEMKNVGWKALQCECECEVSHIELNFSCDTGVGQHKSWCFYSRITFYLKRMHICMGGRGSETDSCIHTPTHTWIANPIKLEKKLFKWCCMAKQLHQQSFVSGFRFRWEWC